MPEAAGTAVFLSYASQDAVAARRICAALQAVGAEVWFDQNQLVGGEAWDAKIRQQISDCTLFVPVISANTQARLEGYFRIEWKLAAVRTHGMAEEKCFLLPVVIDGTPEAEGKVPAEFRAVQWTKLPDGETTPAFVERVRHLLGGRPTVAAATSPGKIGSRGFPLWAVASVGALVLTVGLLWLSRPNPASVASIPAATPAIDRTVALDKRRLAVLPFDNFSSEKDKFEYFADGMTEQMISRLSRVRGLTVKARNAVMKFKGRDKDLTAIGRELGVGTVLESSVRREGNQLRITIQLIDVQTLDHLWSQDFDETFDKVLAIQSDVAERVAGALKVELLGDQIRLVRRQSTANPEAFDDYLRGKFYFGTGREATGRSIELLEKAIALDDAFAEAHAELSLAYGNLAYFLEGGNKELERKAEAAADKALRLDPDLPEAHLAQARIYMRPSNGFQYEKAMAEIRLALGIRSNLDEAHSFLGAIYFHVGLIDQSLEQYQKADEINPGSPTVKFELGVNEFYRGRFEQAVAQMEGAQTGFMRTFSTYRFASALLCSGRTNEARIRVEEACKKIAADPKLKDEGGILTAMQALFLALEGDETQAVEKIKEAQRLGEGFGHFHHTAHVIASAYSLLDENDLGMKWLRYAAENGYPNVTWFRRDPNLVKLRMDPRFEALMAELQPRFERLRRLAETPLAESR